MPESINLSLVQRPAHDYGDICEYNRGLPEPNLKKLPKLIEDWPPEWQFNFHERWAIMEIDGGLSHAHAKIEAEKSTRRSFEQMKAWQNLKIGDNNKHEI